MAGGDRHYLVRGAVADRPACGAPAPWAATSHTDAVSCLQCRATEPYAAAYERGHPSGTHRSPLAVLEAIETAHHTQWVATQAQRLLDQSGRVRAVLAEWGHPSDCMCDVCRHLTVAAALFAKIIMEATQ